MGVGIDPAQLFTSLPAAKSCFVTTGPLPGRSPSSRSRATAAPAAPAARPPRRRPPQRQSSPPRLSRPRQRSPPATLASLWKRLVSSIVQVYLNSTGCSICSETWVGLGLLEWWVFHCLPNSAWADADSAGLAGQLGNMVEQENPSQHNPGLRADETPCTILLYGISFHHL